MNEIKLILLLLVVASALTPVARRLRVPYPVLLVVGGLVLALLPIVPDFPLDPDVVFLVFLPPLVFRAAFTTSVRDFRVLLPHILSLAVGLVLATMAVVAVVLHTLMPSISWPIAFAFGAIVSPPDAVAAAAVFRGLGVPRRIVTLLEGESLINDATALVAYRAALGAVVVAFSAGEAAVGVVVVGIGGVIVGLVVAVAVGWLLHRLSDPAVEITLSLLTPFATYLAAESLGLSGVLATVTAGLYLGWRSSYIWGSEERLRARAVWEIVDFILNGLVFILIGLQLSTIFSALASRSVFSLVGLGLIISASMILVRLVWVFGDGYIRLWLSSALPVLRSRRARQSAGATNVLQTGDNIPKWKQLSVVGWAGMRGVVSLAAALALPAGTPERELLIYLTFFVILVTLVGQGLSLPWLVRALGVGIDNRVIVEQDMHARRTATQAALERLDQLRVQWPGHIPLIDALQAQYEHRASHLGNDNDSENGDAMGESGDGESGEDVDQELLEHHLIRRAVLQAERTALLNLRQQGELDDEIWREIERDLDLEELRMDA